METSSGSTASSSAVRSRSREGDVRLHSNWLFQLMFQVTFLRFIYKKIVHLVTGKCEVHRLLDQLQEKENLASRALLVGQLMLLLPLLLSFSVVIVYM